MIVHAMILLCSLLEDKFDSFDVSTNKWRRSVASSDHDVAVLCKTPEIALTGVLIVLLMLLLFLLLLLLLLLFPMLVKALYILISFIFHVAVGEILNLSRDVLQWVVVDIPVFTGKRSHIAMHAFAADWNDQNPSEGTCTDGRVVHAR